jgi:gas vesicle protein
MPNHDQPANHMPSAERGGFVALAVLAAAVGVGAALLLAPEEGSKARQIWKRRTRSRREKRLVAVTGFVVGAGLTALLAPESGAATRKRLGSTLSRIKVGVVGRIERLRQSDAPQSAQDPPVRSLQELGRDSDNVF